jgi:hypothetical protein
VYVPARVGVPVIQPVDPLRLSPGGKSPPTTAYEYGGQPLPGFHCTWCAYDAPTLPTGVRYDSSV